MKRNVRVYIAGGLIVLAMTALFVSGFDTENMLYSITVEELQTKGATEGDRGYRVNGHVDPMTIRKSDDLLSVHFVVHDSSSAMPVLYRGVLPDTFKPAAVEGDIEVILEGKMGADGTFAATNVLTKCASKYEPESESAEVSS